MRLLTLALIGLLVLVQAGLWFGPGGWQATRKLRTQLAAAEQRNAAQRDRIARPKRAHISHTGQVRNSSSSSCKWRFCHKVTAK